MIFLGIFLGYLGDILRIFWGYFRDILGILWRYFGDVFGIFLEYFGDILGTSMSERTYGVPPVIFVWESTNFQRWNMFSHIIPVEMGFFTGTNIHDEKIKDKKSQLKWVFYRYKNP